MSCRILLTGFRGTSAEQFLSAAREYDTLLLPNDKKRDGELLTDLLSRRQYDLVFCLGQKPNIKDKIYIESTARENGVAIQTNVDPQKLSNFFCEYGIPAKQSNHAGTSFCNALYFSGLQFVNTHKLDTGIAFIHIPFHKNMTCPDSFTRNFISIVDALKMKEVEELWIK